jgi:hypothetical protein
MAKDTLTLALNGDVSLEDYSNAIQQFFNLVKGLHDDISKESSIEWFIEGLEAGSAIATIKGIGQEESDIMVIERVVDAYLDVGRAIQKESPLNYSRPVQVAAKKLTSIINGRIKSVRFETPETDVEIFSSPAALAYLPITKLPEGSFGAVRGRVQSMSNRGQLRFTLYEMIDDRAISCYLTSGNEDIMREAWGKVAMVEGFVRRDPESGYATTVRGVKDIRIIQEGKLGDYRQAIGAAPGFLGDTLPEEIIRKARDA